MIDLKAYDVKHRKAVKRLDEHVRKNFSEEDQDTMGFYNDEITDAHYIWVYELHGKKYKLKCSFTSLEITKIEL